MSDEFTLSEELRRELESAVRRNGGTVEDVLHLCGGENFRKVALWRMGKVKLVEVTEVEQSDVAIPVELAPTTFTVDNEGNIHFSLTSNGMTPERWKIYLKRRGFQISDWAHIVLNRVSEPPTSGVTYNIVVCPSKCLSERNRVTDKICAMALECEWRKPHWEVACLIRDHITDEQLKVMGLWYVVTMHESVKDSEGVPYLLFSSAGEPGCGLGADYDRPDDYWSDKGGFAFVVQPADEVGKSVLESSTTSVPA